MFKTDERRDKAASSTFEGVVLHRRKTPHEKSPLMKVFLLLSPLLFHIKQ